MGQQAVFDFEGDKTQETPRNTETPRGKLPEALKYGGSTLLVAWFLLFFSGELWGFEYDRASELASTLSLVSITSCSLTLVVLNILGQKGLIPERAGGFLFILPGILLSLATVGITAGHIIATPYYLASCIVVGVCGAFFLCVAVLQLARLTSRSILIVCGGIFLGGIFIYSFAFYVPRVFTIPIICLLPLFASLFFVTDRTVASHKKMTWKHKGEKRNTVGEKRKTVLGQQSMFVEVSSSQNEDGTNGKSVSWRAVIVLSVFMLFFCVIRGYIPINMDTEYFSYIRSFSIILMLIAGALVVIVMILLPEEYQLSKLYKWFFLGGVVFFALLPIFGMASPLVLVLADAFRGLSALITLTLFACMLRHMPFFGFRNVGGALTLFVVFGLFGWFVGVGLSYAELNDNVLRVYSSIQCVVVLLAFLLLFRQTEIEVFLDREPKNSFPVQNVMQSVDSTPEWTEESSGAGGRWRQRISRIAKEKGLTAREVEIFILLAKGFKAQNISDRLSVSYNTTRAHIRSIYQKCDVHSQQEFIDLVESPPDTSQKR